MNNLLSINHGLIKSRAVINGAKVFFASETVTQSKKWLVLHQLKQVFPELEGDKVLLLNKQARLVDAMDFIQNAQSLGYVVVVNELRQVDHQQLS